MSVFLLTLINEVSEVRALAGSLHATEGEVLALSRLAFNVKQVVLFKSRHILLPYVT